MSGQSISSEKIGAMKLRGGVMDADLVQLRTRADDRESFVSGDLTG